MTIWWLFVLWSLGSTLLGLAFALGAGIGYRRGWEERSTCEWRSGDAPRDSPAKRLD